MSDPAQPSDPSPEQPREKAAYGDEEIHAVHRQLMREKPEPTEAYSPVPMLLLFLFGALAAWGGGYFMKYSGDFRYDVYNPEWSPGSGGGNAEVAFDPLKKGERLFKNNCQACHQATGQGVPGAFPPLAGSPWVVGDDHRIVKIVLRGMQGPIEVLGNEFNGNMPSYGENGLGWNDRDIAAVTTWVRQAWGNGAPPVEEATVALVREEIADHSGHWDPADILSAHPLE